MYGCGWCNWNSCDPCWMSEQDASKTTRESNKATETSDQLTNPIDSLFGKVYVYYVTDSEFISYNFDSPQNCYISYANAPPNWRLGNGLKAPAKQIFLKTNYDTKTRTFTASID